MVQRYFGYLGNFFLVPRSIRSIYDPYQSHTCVGTSTHTLFKTGRDTDLYHSLISLYEQLGLFRLSMRTRGSQRARAWCFTINNPTTAERGLLQSFGDRSSTKYIVCGDEVGSGCQTRHIQGYMYLANPRSLSGIKSELVFARAHLEISKGNPRQAADYCKKDGDFWEKGVLPGQGRRSDLDDIKKEIEEGTSMLDIAGVHFAQWCQYRRSFDAYRRLLNGAERTWKSWTNVIVGRTGTGKTRFVFQQHEGRDRVYVWGGDRWFDGYSGQRVALLDDFRGELEVGFLLRLLDRYPMQVPVKGGFVNWNPRRIYITSNHLPPHWYDNLARESLEAIERRIDRLDIVNESIFE